MLERMRAEDLTFIAERFLGTDSRLGLGGQISTYDVSSGEYVDVAVGCSLPGVPLSPSTAYPAYCLVKPLAAVAIGHLMDLGAVDLAQPIGTLVGDYEPLLPSASVTVGEVLSHNAGLENPVAFEWRICPPSDRADLLNRYRRPAGERAVYSELLSGLMIERIIENTCGIPAHEFVTDVILTPLGVANDFAISPLQSDRLFDERLLAVPVRVAGGTVLSLISEALPQQRNDIRLAFGAFCTVKGMNRVFAGLLKSIRGEAAVPGLPSATALRSLLEYPRASRHDAICERQPAYSAGFAVQLQDHQVASLTSDQAFGHSGGVALSFALADPELGMTVTAMLNGCLLDFPELFERRLHLADQVIEVAKQ